MAVLIGDIVPRASVFNDDHLQLEGAFGIRPVMVGEQTYVYVAGRLDGGISAFRVGADGSLTGIQDIDDGPPTAPLQLKGATHFASLAVGGTQYLYVTGSLSDGLSAFRIGDDGTLTHVQSIDDATAPDLELDGVSGKPVVATFGDTTYLVTSADDDNGLSVWLVGSDGRLTNTFNVTDDRTLNLDDAHDLALATVGGHTFVCVAAGGADNGLSVFELGADGHLANTFNVSDDATLNLGNLWGLAAATVDGVTYIIGSGRDDGGLSVFALDEAGTLTNVANVGDDAARGLAGAFGLSTFTLDGETFVVASGTDDSALTVFHLEAGGALTDVTTVFDTVATALGYSVDNAFAMIDGRPMLFGSGYVDGGLTSFEIGGGNDRLRGTADADLLMGFAGDDLLNGRGGGDRMIGGSGDDTYLLDSADDQVVEQAGGGIDSLRSVVTARLGANVENLNLLGRDDIDAGGNALANLLSGNGSVNRLAGRGGDDLLHGGQGADRVLGGDGDDRLWGGKGADLMKGGDGTDDFVFLKTDDSGPDEATRDTILAFGVGDRLDLRAVDAIHGGADDAFQLDRDGSFSAGEIRVTTVAGGTLVEMNVDGDDLAEMAILLRGFHGTLGGGDLLL